MRFVVEFVLVSVFPAGEVAVDDGDEGGTVLTEFELFVAEFEFWSANLIACKFKENTISNSIQEEDVFFFSQILMEIWL